MRSPFRFFGLVFALSVPIWLLEPGTWPITAAVGVPLVAALILVYRGRGAQRRTESPEQGVRLAEDPAHLVRAAFPIRAGSPDCRGQHVARLPNVTSPTTPVARTRRLHGSAAISVIRRIGGATAWRVNVLPAGEHPGDQNQKQSLAATHGVPHKTFAVWGRQTSVRASSVALVTHLKTDGACCWSRLLALPGWPSLAPRGD
jgi:hypothetical protein